jgi:hypothetical protein
MSRTLDFSKPLTPEDHQYALERPWLIRDAELSGFEVQVEGDFDADEEPEADPYEDRSNRPTEEDETPPYSEWKVDDLKAEIASRNEDREDESQIVVEAPGNRPQLIAALEADDDLED